MTEEEGTISSAAPVLADKFIFYGTKSDSILTQKCSEVKDFDDGISKLVETLEATIEYYQAFGCAAPQIGVDKRVFVAQINGKLQEFINPVILEKDGESKEQEGCLSFPGAVARIIRAAEVVVSAQTRTGENFTQALDGLSAVIVQHELDHLDGVLFIERMSPLYKRRVLKHTKKILKKYNLK